MPRFRSQSFWFVALPVIQLWAGSAVTTASAQDSAELVAVVLLEAAREATQDLRSYKEKVEFLNQQKAEIRAQLEELRKQLETTAEEDQLAEVEREIDDLEQELEVVDDDAQLANIDLQNALQKQQQALQLLSNISKTLHDAAIAVIRKVGG
jgi:uncharacterized protein (DUF3084 family)